MSTWRSCIEASCVGPALTPAHVIDGVSALRILEEEIPDLIVVDMNLPVLNGDQLLREMAAHPELRQIPAIVVTGEDIRPNARGRTGQTDSSEAVSAGSACFRSRTLRPRRLIPLRIRDFRLRRHFGLNVAEA
jgi:CheY-like chemotaxis protein